MSSDTYLVPDLAKDEIHRTELVIKKSRFIASVARTHGVEESKILKNEDDLRSFLFD